MQSPVFQHDEILTDYDDDDFEYSIELSNSFSFQEQVQESQETSNSSEATTMHTTEDNGHEISRSYSPIQMQVLDFPETRLPSEAMNECDADDENSCSESESDDVDMDMVMDIDISEPESRSSEAVTRIEDMVLSFLTQLVNVKGASKPNQENPKPKKKKRPSIEIALVDRKKTVDPDDPKFKYIKFPSKAGAKALAQLFRVLDLTHEAVLNNVPVTKRDMYYQDVPLFKNQKTVDTLVDDLAATFELERSDLKIRATSKGLISGSGLTIQLLSGEFIQAMDTEGTLIPVGEDIQSFSIDEDVSWVLIVEKEAVFQTLTRMKVVDHLLMPGRGLLITGKGYPDMATRHLVKSLADALPRSIPIMILVDMDPYGLDILSVYKYGSQALQHESTKLAARRVKWLGLRSTELESFGVDRASLIPITKQDEKKALAMLRRPSVTLPNSWKKELQRVLYTRRKAEIEVLTTTASTSQDFSALFSGLPKSYAAPDVGSSADTRHDGIGTPRSASSLARSDRSFTGLEDSSHLMHPDRASSEPHPALLLRYLANKIAALVSSARASADAVL